MDNNDIEISLFDIFKVIYRRKLLLASFVVGGLIVAIFYNIFVPKIYESTLLIKSLQLDIENARFALSNSDVLKSSGFDPDSITLKKLEKNVDITRKTNQFFEISATGKSSAEAKNLADLAINIISKLNRNDLTDIERSINSLNSEIKELTQYLNILEKYSNAWFSVKFSLEEKQKLLDSDRASLNKNEISIVKNAELPVIPVSPNVQLNLAMGFLLGLLIGLFYIFLK